MTDKQIMIDSIDVSGCILRRRKEPNCTVCNGYSSKVFEFDCSDFKNCYYKQLVRKTQEYEELKKKCNIYTCGICGNKEDCNKLYKTLTEIKEIAEPYKMTIKKICGNCKKYDDCHACCYKDINCYKYTSSETNACEEFVYLDKFVPNLLANNILQKISEEIK